jgi:hypothetical protein
MYGLVILGFFLVAAGIPIAGMIYAYHEKKLKLRQKELDVLGRRAAQDSADHAARIEWLEERMGVVERIVTDRGLSLSDEIERLRDRPVREIRDRRDD